MINSTVGGIVPGQTLDKKIGLDAITAFKHMVCFPKTFTGADANC